jgi:hypothetical protein
MRRDFPMQEALHDLVGLAKAFGEGDKELHGELWTALYDLGGVVAAKPPVSLSICPAHLFLREA